MIDKIRLSDSGIEQVLHDFKENVRRANECYELLKDSDVDIEFLSVRDKNLTYLGVFPVSIGKATRTETTTKVYGRKKDNIGGV